MLAGASGNSKCNCAAGRLGLIGPDITGISLGTRQAAFIIGQTGSRIACIDCRAARLRDQVTGHSDRKFVKMRVDIGRA